MSSPIRRRPHPLAAFVGGTLLLTPTVAAADDTPTFSRDVAPILFEKCVQCHRPNQAAPMSLLSYREARPWARGMARAVENGDMPPWSAESEHVVFRNDLSLSAEQIATITDWAAGGAPEGDPADLPPAPTFPEGWTLGE
ncbi:MAG: alkyl hydroperoxide reductase, partial [Holophagales bacterium]|nr:alkyl hydroperoxide reductase [Holophagales bacterium]